MEKTFYGIYNADGTILGEIKYVYMKVSGTGSCALCDITHTWTGRKASFDQACQRASIRFVLLHTNEATPEQLQAALELPAVLIQENGVYRKIMGPQELADCHKDPETLMSKLSQ